MSGPLLRKLKASVAELAGLDITARPQPQCGAIADAHYRLRAAAQEEKWGSEAHDAVVRMSESPGDTDVDRLTAVCARFALDAIHSHSDADILSTLPPAEKCAAFLRLTEMLDSGRGACKTGRAQRFCAETVCLVCYDGLS